MSLADLGHTVAKYAPLLGSILPIPGAAAIGAVIAKEFGGDINNPDELAKKIQADPEAQIKLLTIQSNERIEIERIAVDRIRAENEGRKNAYQREIEVNKIPKKQRDNTLKQIAFAFIGGYFLLSSLILAAIWSQHVTAEEIQPIIQMQKDLGMAVMLILAYFYSASYERNDQQ